MIKKIGGFAFVIPNVANIGHICRVRITPLMPIGVDEMLQETFPIMALGAGTSCPTPNLYWQILVFAN
jgi:hypothetical protein